MEEPPMMKYQMVETHEDGTEEVLAEVHSADFATQLVQETRRLAPEGDFRIRTVA